MFDLEEHTIVCPFCFESIQIEVEPLEQDQSYIQDCNVCCNPISIEVVYDQGKMQIQSVERSQ